MHPGSHGTNTLPLLDISIDVVTYIPGVGSRKRVR